MSVPAVYGPTTDFTGPTSGRSHATGFALQSSMTVATPQEAPVRRPPLARFNRELSSYAALGYATLALSVARDGRRVDAAAGVEAATELLASVADANPYLAVHIRLAIARTEVMIGDLDAARSAMWEVQALMKGLPDDENLRNDARKVMAAITEQCDRAPVGSQHITPAEARVLNLLPNHSTYREIASSLHISHNTVKSHAYSVYRKLGVRSRSEAVRLSRRLGLVAA